MRGEQLRGNPLVAGIPVDPVNALEAPHGEPFQVKLQSDARKRLRPKGFLGSAGEAGAEAPEILMRPMHTLALQETGRETDFKSLLAPPAKNRR
jgi:hypothetical protein